MLAQRVITWTEEWKEQGVIEGLAKGQARSILMLLETRGVAVPEAMREKITACRDADQLDLWFRRAITAASIEELFSDS